MSVECIPPACQPYMLWWQPLGVSTGGGYLRSHVQWEWIYIHTHPCPLVYLPLWYIQPPSGISVPLVYLSPPCGIPTCTLTYRLGVGIPEAAGECIPEGGGGCCDIGQIDIFSRIELIPSFVLSSRVANYKNDIQ